MAILISVAVAQLARSVSEDGGATWQITGRLPRKMIRLAASARRPERIFAATARRLMVREGRGVSFHLAAFPGETVSAVAVSPEGEVFVSVIGRGLLIVSEDKLSDCIDLNSAFGEAFPLRFALHPTKRDYIAVVTQANDVLDSADGGKTFGAFGKGP